MTEENDSQSVQSQNPDSIELAEASVDESDPAQQRAVSPPDSTVAPELKQADDTANAVTKPHESAFGGCLENVLKMLFIFAIFVLGVFIGLVGSNNHAPHDHGNNMGDGDAGSSKTKKEETWSCSMHPQIKLKEAGKCPICFMDLIVLDKGSGEDEGAALTMSEAAVQLSEIQTTVAIRQTAKMKIDFVGMVDFDETRIKTISSRIPGRLDRVYVDYTGVKIHKGDHLVYLYSPELISAQEELLQAIKAVSSLENSSSELMKDTSQSTVNAGREKLRLLGVTDDQIEKLEESGEVNDHLTIYAPIGGVVIHKNAVEGMYVKTGSPIYKIADLSVLWVRLEAYETDLEWLFHGQAVRFETKAYPGEFFEGRISFIDPVLNPATRTVKVRAQIDNSDSRLKPGMFLSASVTARLSGPNSVSSRNLAGKWVSPMHPEIVKDGPGVCDVCGMPLVTAESMGLVNDTTVSEAPILIPSSAVLQTGTRSVVYVKKPDSKRPSFEGRLIILGPKVNDHFIVRSGLKAGERVVTNGAFKIDSALQIQAKPSMMSTPLVEDSDQSSAEDGVKLEIEAKRRVSYALSLSDLIEHYLDLQEALASDSMSKLDAILKARHSVVNAPLKLKGAPIAWYELLEDLADSLSQLKKTNKIEDRRRDFNTVTMQLKTLVEAVGSPIKMQIVHCPMAFSNSGADWFQKSGPVANPYFGAAMLRCGEVKQEFNTLGQDQHSNTTSKPVSKQVGSPSSKPASRPTADHSQNTKVAASQDLKNDHSAAIAAFLSSYLEIQIALSADNSGKVTKLAMSLNGDAVANGRQAILWLKEAKTLKRQRVAFYELTKSVAAQISKQPAETVVKASCPMAFSNTGAYWFQRPGKLANPYFGESMLRCGSIVETYTGAAK